jgi:hypothetical protein
VAYKTIIRFVEIVENVEMNKKKSNSGAQKCQMQRAKC